MDHGRLHWYEPGELNEDQRRVYDAITGGPRSVGPQAIQRLDEEGRLFGPFNAMLVDPGVGEILQALGAAIRYRTEISGRAREIAILEVARAHKSEFEWYAHRETGYLAGLSADEVEAIRTGGEAASLSEEERRIRELVQALVRDRDLSDAQYAQAHESLGLQLVTDLVYLTGYYEALALSLNVFRVPLPPGVAPAF
ncbi:MAG TPA: carboxymuconolactone decarboxylase family protein [Acidimicrobiales bacterium]|nr:carboxymuconolactone decarboxylase family protein [Acidimicrobiales bacterium]